MSGKEFVALGAALIALALAGLATTQFAMRRWKKRYDTEWEHNE